MSPIFNSEYMIKLKEYIRMEYDEEIADKMYQSKYFDITLGYVKNCIHLKKTIPYNKPRCFVPKI